VKNRKGILDSFRKCFLDSIWINYEYFQVPKIGVPKIDPKFLETEVVHFRQEFVDVSSFK